MNIHLPKYGTKDFATIYGKAMDKPRLPITGAHKFVNIKVRLMLRKPLLYTYKYIKIELDLEELGWHC